MRDENTPLRNRLYDLEAEDQAAGERAQVARLRQQGDAYRAAERETLAELHDHHDRIAFKMPGATLEEERTARRREITDAILAAVGDRGLVFAPTPGPSRGLLIVDPALDAAAEAAEAEAREAKRAVKDFIRGNVAAMDEENRRANDAEFAAALAAGNVEAVRGILRPRDETESGALPTADLPENRQRVTRGA
jgi:hypothetical protein